MLIRIQNSELRIKNWLLLFCILYSAFCINKTSAQANISTPYSRFGIGDIESPGFARNLGMGGLGIAVSSPFNINFMNPASYSALSITTFEGGLQGNFTSLSANGQSATSASTSFGYFAFGFPLKAGKWGFSFGLVPFSSVNYAITDIEPNPSLSTVTYTYNGSGEINQFYIGTGYSLFKNLRVGVNAAYLFGTLNQVRTIAIPDNVYYFNTQITNATTIGDFRFTFGLQWTLDSLKISPTDSMIAVRNKIGAIRQTMAVLKDSLANYQKRLQGHAEMAEFMQGSIATVKDSLASLNKQIDAENEIKKHIDRRRARRDWSFNFGANVSLATNANAYRSTLTQLFVYTSDGFITPKDTAQNIASETGVVQIPLFAGFGFTMKKGAKWLFGADVSTQNWSSYRSFGVSDSLVNSVLYTIGAQYTPDERSISSYKKVIQYRLGFHYNQTYLDLRNTQLNDYGVSIGAGFPMRKTLTVLHLAFEVGRMGTEINQLVQVTYFRFTVGLSMSDVWFLKPRID